MTDYMSDAFEGFWEANKPKKKPIPMAKPVSYQSNIDMQKARLAALKTQLKSRKLQEQINAMNRAKTQQNIKYLAKAGTSVARSTSAAVRAGVGFAKKNAPYVKAGIERVAATPLAQKVFPKPKVASGPSKTSEIYKKYFRDTREDSIYK